MSSCLDVKMEDIGQIGCEVKNTASDTVYATLAVCGKPNKPRHQGRVSRRFVRATNSLDP